MELIITLMIILFLGLLFAAIGITAIIIFWLVVWAFKDLRELNREDARDREE